MSERLCPICNTKAQEFGTYGVSNRPDAQCLNCGSTERYRLLYFYLSKETDFFTSKTNTFVDIGPNNSLTNLLKPLKGINHISVDIGFGKSRIQGDVTNLPIVNSITDYLLCYHVLEHVGDYKTGLSEIYRVMKPQTLAFIQVPIDINRKGIFEVSTVCPKERHELYGQEDHLRIFGNDFSLILRSVGFKVDRLKYVESFSLKERELYGLKDTYKIVNYETSEDIFIARKP
jgi:SAM-dependent methyltransferase